MTDKYYCQECYAELFSGYGERGEVVVNCKCGTVNHVEFDNIGEPNQWSYEGEKREG